MPTLSSLATLAYRRRGLLGATATAIWITFGRPVPIGFQVLPPSVDLNRPPDVPSNEPFSHGACCCCHKVAYTICGLDGSESTSSPLVYSSLYNTFWKVLPPSVERKMPRSGFGPYGWPIAATNSRSGVCGSTITCEIFWVSRRPRCVQVLPASVDLYMPSPMVPSGRMMPSPLPT